MRRKFTIICLTVLTLVSLVSLSSFFQKPVSDDDNLQLELELELEPSIGQNALQFADFNLKSWERLSNGDSNLQDDDGFSGIGPLYLPSLETETPENNDLALVILLLMVGSVPGWIVGRYFSADDSYPTTEEAQEYEYGYTV